MNATTGSGDDGVRINLLFGFLGSGKTTLARRLLVERAGDLRTAVIVNEFGDVGIDGEILRGANVDMVELSSGCVCCQLRGSLMLAIDELRAKAGVQRIIVEATGIAQPGELLETLADASLRARVAIGPLVTVVDSAKFFKLEQMLGDFYAAQVENADIVVLNKCDLVDAAALGRVEAAAREMNPGATVLFAEQCEVDTRLLLDGDLSSLVGRQIGRLPLTGSATVREEHGHRLDDDRHGHGQEHGGEHEDGEAHEHGRGHGHGHGHGIDHGHDSLGAAHSAMPAESFVLDASGGGERAQVERFFAALPDSVWRAKGFLLIDGAPSLVQYSLGQLEITATSARSHANMVFIGRGLDRAAIAREFAFASASTAGPVAGPARAAG